MRGSFFTAEKYNGGVLNPTLVNKSIGTTPLTKHNMDKEDETLKLKEEKANQ